MIPVGGTVPASGFLVLPRSEDAEFLAAAREGRWFTVSGCRTMGKSTLVSRWRGTLESEGIRVACVDLAAQIGAPEEAEQWLDAVAESLALDLGLEASATNLIPARVRGGAAMGGALTALLHALGKAGDGRLLVVLDEVDFVAGLPYAREVLFALRGSQTDHARRPDESVALCCVGLRAVHELGSPEEGTGSPIGARIVLRDFEDSDDTVDALSAVLAADPAPGQAVARRVLHHTGGQPFLTMLLAELTRRADAGDEEAVDAVVDRYLDQQRAEPSDLFLQIEELIIERELRAFGALSTYLDILDGKLTDRSADAPEAWLLRLSGLVRVRDDRLEPKGPAFARHFDAAWARRTLARAGSREQGRPRPAWRTSEKRPRICVLNTGGTIGMFPRGNEVRPPETKWEFEREFLRNYGHIREIADIDPKLLFSDHGVNVGPPRWTHVAQAIYDKRDEGYRGFVVAHGTDTMAHTASAVAFALGPNLSFPVVFTGSQTTPDVPHGDARANMLRACMVALEDIPEVVVCFGHHVYRGTRTQKRDERRFDGFESPAWPALADITETIEVHKEFLRPRPDDLGDIELRAEFAAGVLLVQLTPGLEPDFYLPALQARDPEGRRLCRGVIVQTLGAGNVATEGASSFLGLISGAIRAGIPVLVTSPYPWRPDPRQRFAPAVAAVELGAVATGEMTAAAAVTKFRWLLAQRPEMEDGEGALLDFVRDRMLANEVGELSIYRPGQAPGRTAAPERGA